MHSRAFRSIQFTVQQEKCALKVSTDGIALGAWTEVSGADRILDIGTGTGILALIAAQRNATALIDAVEMDEAAAEQAGANVADSPWADRVKVHHSDIHSFTTDLRYDLILCNPPYYSAGLMSNNARIDMAKHRLGLSFPDLIGVVSRLLAPTGHFTCIVPFTRVTELVDLAATSGLYPRRKCVLHYVHGRPPKRALLEFGKSLAVCTEHELIVQREPGVYTEAYRALTHDLLLGV